MAGSSRGRPNSGSTISASSTRLAGISALLPRLRLADLWLTQVWLGLYSADEHGAALSQRLGSPRYNKLHSYEPDDQHDYKDVRRQIHRISGNRPDCDKQHRYQ